MSLIQLNKAQEKRIKEQRLVKHNGRLGLAYSQLRHFSREQIRTQLLFEAIYNQMRAFRFVSCESRQPLEEVVDVAKLRE